MIGWGDNGGGWLGGEKRRKIIKSPQLLDGSFLGKGFGCRSDDLLVLTNLHRVFQVTNGGFSPLPIPFTPSDAKEEEDFISRVFCTSEGYFFLSHLGAEFCAG